MTLIETIFERATMESTFHAVHSDGRTESRPATEADIIGNLFSGSDVDNYDCDPGIDVDLLETLALRTHIEAFLGKCGLTNKPIFDVVESNSNSRRYEVVPVSFHTINVCKAYRDLIEQEVDRFFESNIYNYMCYITRINIKEK